MTVSYMITQALEVFWGWKVARELFPERKKDSVLSVGMEITAVVFAGGLYAYNASFSYISASIVLVYGFILGALYKLFYQCIYKKTAICFLIYFHSIAILKMPLLTVRGIVEGKNIVQVNSAARNIWEVLFVFVLLLTVFVSVRREGIKKYLNMLLQKFSDSLLWIVIVEALLLKYVMNVGGEGFRPLDFITNILVIVCIIITFTLSMILVIYQDIKNEEHARAVTENILRKQYRELSELYEKNHQRLHDVKHVLGLLRQCIENGNSSEALNVLDDYTKIQKNMQKTWTGIASLDFILNYKIAEIEENDIKIRLDINVWQVNMEELELMIILGNLLDNAIEAAKQCRLQDRFISFQMRNINEMIMITVENSCIKKARCREGRFQSTKKDLENHGYGVQSVKNIVEKYDGEISFKYSERLFEVEIIM